LRQRHNLVWCFLILLWQVIRRWLFKVKDRFIPVGVQPLGCSSYRFTVPPSDSLEYPAKAGTTNQYHQCQAKACTPTLKCILVFASYLQNTTLGEDLWGSMTRGQAS
jgi:hypothetical protein